MLLTVKHNYKSLDAIKKTVKVSKCLTHREILKSVFKNTSRADVETRWAGLA